MRRIIALAAGLAAIPLCTVAARADAEFSDSTCSQATVPVRVYAEKIKNPNTTVDDAVIAAQKVVDAYDLCAADKLSRGEIETLQYAHLLAAQYEYIIGGWQHLDGNDGLAKIAFQRSQKLAEDIVDWHPMSQVYYASNDVNIGSGSGHNAYANGVSRYHEDAVKLRDNSIKAISMLGKPGAPAAAPPAAAPPAAAPQPAKSGN